MPSETMNRREGACTCSASQPLDGNNATELARRNIGAPARCVRLSCSACAAVLATTLVALGGCSENGAVGKTVNPSGSQSQTSGPAYERPEALRSPPFDQAAAGGENGVSIDASNLAKGYVAVSATASTRLKFQISFEGSETQYYFDLPSDGHAHLVPSRSRQRRVHVHRLGKHYRTTVFGAVLARRPACDAG